MKIIASKHFSQKHIRAFEAAIMFSSVFLDFPGIKKIEFRTLTRKAPIFGYAFVSKKTGVIKIMRDLDPVFMFELIVHELTHIDQFARGDLFHDKNGDLRWRKMPCYRAPDLYTYEQYKQFPWEAEAYAFCDFALNFILDKVN